MVCCGPNSSSHPSFGGSLVGGAVIHGQGCIGASLLWAASCRLARADPDLASLGGDRAAADLELAPFHAVAGSCAYPALLFSTLPPGPRTLLGAASGAADPGLGPCDTGPWAADLDLAPLGLFLGPRVSTLLRGTLSLGPRVSALLLTVPFGARGPQPCSVRR